MLSVFYETPSWISMSTFNATALSRGQILSRLLAVMALIFPPATDWSNVYPFCSAFLAVFCIKNHSWIKKGWLFNTMPVLSLQTCKRKGPNRPFVYFSGGHLWLQRGIPAMARSGRNTELVLIELQFFRVITSWPFRSFEEEPFVTAFSSHKSD